MPSNIIGIPTTRISDQFVRSRLLRQVQFDQRELFRLETQLSTGRRFERPSEDPVAAARILSLQRLLERKEQVRSNLATNQSYLTASDVAMSQISDMVNDVRGTALGVAGTLATNEQRQAAARESLNDQKCSDAFAEPRCHREGRSHGKRPGPKQHDGRLVQIGEPLLSATQYGQSRNDTDHGARQPRRT